MTVPLLDNALSSSSPLQRLRKIFWSDMIPATVCASRSVPYWLPSNSNDNDHLHHIKKVRSRFFGWLIYMDLIQEK